MNNLNDIFFTPSANQELTYEQILEDVQRYFAENHAATIAEAGEGNTERASSLLKELMVQYIVKRKYAIATISFWGICNCRSPTIRYRRGVHFNISDPVIRQGNIRRV